MAEVAENDASSTAMVVSSVVESSAPLVRKPARRATSFRSP